MKTSFVCKASILMLLIFTACVDEKENIITPIKDVLVEGLEKTYVVHTKVGDKLEISPIIEFDGSEEDFDFYWYIVDPRLELNEYEIIEVGDEVYEAELIGREKNLSYEMNLPLGDYKLFFKVENKNNGYGTIKMAELGVLSYFSSGFYILKENIEGDTDLDLFAWDMILDEQTFVGDLLKNSAGVMKGAPRALGVCYNHSYTVNDNRVSGNTLCITTETNDIKFLSTDNLDPVIDLSNMFYETPSENEIPYTTVQGHFSHHYISNRGVSSVYSSLDGGSGIFPEPLGGGGSRFVTYSNTAHIIYWDSSNHNIMTCDFNGSVSTLKVFANAQLEATNLTHLDCKAIGQNLIGSREIIYLLMEDINDGKRYLYFVEQENRVCKLSKVTALDENLHLSQANMISTNGRDATIVYCVHQNKLYAHNLDYSSDLSSESERERELTLQGLPGNEQISYITNQYWLGTNKNYHCNFFIVVTSKGDSYTINFYEMLGGEPVGAPVKTIKGTGRVKSIRYLVPTAQRGDALNAPMAD